MSATTQDAIEAINAKLDRLIHKAETGADWAEIARIEEVELIPLRRVQIIEQLLG